MTSEAKDVEEEEAKVEPPNADQIAAPNADQVTAPNADQVTAPIAPPIRGAFRMGALLATLLIIPGLSTLVHLLAREPLAIAMGFDEVFATVGVFAGLPALLVFGGIGKNISRLANKSRKSMILRGAALGAVAGMSLAPLAAVPTATLPSAVGGGITLMSLAAAIGATTGGLLGLWIQYAHKRACAASEA